MSIHELRAQRATLFDQCKAVLLKPDFDEKTDGPESARLKKSIEEIDAAIARALQLQELAAKSAVPASGQEDHPRFIPAAPKQDKDHCWTDDAAASRLGLQTSKGMIIGGAMRCIAASGGSKFEAAGIAKEMYGESHPVTKALLAGQAAAGGFIVPPEYVNEIIELLRPQAVVRASNPRVLPMPRGTMRLPAQTSAATAAYGGENTPPAQSQPGLGQIVATYKKLKALVPISNDLMRFADPAADAFVRDDLVKVMALREDKAFLTGDGAQDSPRGFTSFANEYALANGGTAGIWKNNGNSTAAAGGNFITSTASFTLDTVGNELAGLINKLDTANVPEMRRKWFMHPRSYNFLNNARNSLGIYVYREEMSRGTLLGYPFAKSTQIPADIWDTSGTNKDCSFVILAEMMDAMILDSMSLELAVSREGTYKDSLGATQSAFSNDETIIRGIMEHDFQMRHAASVAVAQFVRWAPALT